MFVPLCYVVLYFLCFVMCVLVVLRFIYCLFRSSMFHSVIYIICYLTLNCLFSSRMLCCVCYVMLCNVTVCYVM